MGEGGRGEWRKFEGPASALMEIESMTVEDGEVVDVADQENGKVIPIESLTSFCRLVCICCSTALVPKKRQVHRRRRPSAHYLLTAAGVCESC